MNKYERISIKSKPTGEEGGEEEEGGREVQGCVIEVAQGNSMKIELEPSIKPCLNV